MSCWLAVGRIHRLCCNPQNWVLRLRRSCVMEWSHGIERLRTREFALLASDSENSVPHQVVSNFFILRQAQVLHCLGNERHCFHCGNWGNRYSPQSVEFLALSPTWVKLMDRALDFSTLCNRTLRRTFTSCTNAIIRPNSIHCSLQLG